MITKTYTQYFANAIHFETDSTGIQKPCPVKNFRVNMAAGAGVTTIVAAATGKVLRILTLNVYTDTATTGFNLQSNATISFDDWAIFQQRNYWSEPEIGVTDSLVGQPIQAQIGAGSAFTFSGRYIEFTP